MVVTESAVTEAQKTPCDEKSGIQVARRKNNHFPREKMKRNRAYKARSSTRVSEEKYNAHLLTAT